METPVMASTIASLIQNIVYLVFNLSFHCTSGKAPEMPNKPCEYQEHGHSHNQRESHNEININNNQNNQNQNGKTSRNKKRSNTKNTND